MNRLGVGLVLLGFVVPARVEAAPWEDATPATIGVTGEWSNKVELADVDGDGLVDIVLANGGGYATPGEMEPSRVFLNRGAGQTFSEATEVVFGDTSGYARVVEARDVDADGVVDIVVGTTWQTQSRLFRGAGGGAFVEETAQRLPQLPLSVGDLELGDVDDDGDLDLVLADWGAGNPSMNAGGRTRLWLNDGTGGFDDATEEAMPDLLVRWSWELELADVDNDRDLDVLVSCKSCSGSFLLRNDGTGLFTDASEDLPAYANNYDFEVMDLDGDTYVDLVTINDGPGLSEHVFINDGAGGFSDETDPLWPDSENVGEDDNMAVFLDYESDADPDLLIGSLSGADRLLLNDGSGAMTLDDAVFTGASSPGTLGVAVADLDGDTRVDVVQAQGEVASPDLVFLGVDVPPDTAAPTITNVETFAAHATSPVRVRARVHDRKTPTMPHDFERVQLRARPLGAPGETMAPMTWYGEALWRGELVGAPGDQLEYRVCATDAAGNEDCSEPELVTIEGEGEGEGEAGEDSSTGGNESSQDGSSAGETDAAGGTDADGDAHGCACGTGPGSDLQWSGLLVLLLGRRRSAILHRCVHRTVSSF